MIRLDRAGDHGLRRISRLAILGLTGLAVGSAVTAAPTSAASSAGFSAPSFVDTVRAGGGIAGEAYMTTDTLENGHELFRTGNYADSCSATGIIDNGTVNGESYSGFGKLVYDPFDGSLIEPAQFVHADGSIGVGISRLPHARDAFNGGGETWQPREIVYPTTVYSPFGVPELISMDSAENIYFATDPNARDPHGTS